VFGAIADHPFTAKARGGLIPSCGIGEISAGIPIRGGAFFRHDMPT
jgi:hypothetical protein